MSKSVPPRSTRITHHPAIIRAMYQAAQRFGFQGGQVLEPACGIGHFIGLMPDEMLRQSTVTGIEIDPLTARIAKALYPDADIREQPFEKSKLADESFDLAISNVPFGDYTVHDPRWNKHKFPIHDYFFPAVAGQGATGRPAHVHHFTSHDGQAGFNHARDARRQSGIARRNPAAQRCLQEKCRHGSHHRHRDAPQIARRESPCGATWKTSVDFTNEQKEKIPLNEYFVAHPGMMLGKMRLARGMYRDGEPVLVPDGRDFEEALAQAVERLPQNIYQTENQRVAARVSDVNIPAPDYIKPNAFCVHEDGRVCIPVYE